MSKPIIGIVAKPDITTDMWHYMSVVDDIRYVLLKNGVIALGILPTELRLEFDGKCLVLEDGLETVLDHVDGSRLCCVRGSL